jgi:hypothetical protein
MMHQLEISYFFPLTEQINLDLDFTLTEKYILDKRAEQAKNSVTSGMLLSVGNGGTTWTTISSNIGSPSFTINVDAMPITIISKKKPNFILKFIYKSMGMKWKAE